MAVGETERGNQPYVESLEEGECLFLDRKLFGLTVAIKGQYSKGVFQSAERVRKYDEDSQC